MLSRPDVPVSRQPFRQSFRRSSRQPTDGFSLIEILLIVAILGLVAAVGYPPFARTTSALRLELAAEQAAATLQAARIYAVRHRAKVAVKFHTDDDGTVTFALYRDGDGDGVRKNDIATGRDPEVWAPRRVTYLDHTIRFGFPEGQLPRHPGHSDRRLERRDDPIRFNRSDMASFNPLGTATPGSIYLTDHYGHLVAVRVYHLSGKISVLTYDAENEVWRR